MSAWLLASSYRTSPSGSVLQSCPLRSKGSRLVSFFRLNTSHSSSSHAAVHITVYLQLHTHTQLFIASKLPLNSSRKRSHTAAFQPPCVGRLPRCCGPTRSEQVEPVHKRKAKTALPNEKATFPLVCSCLDIWSFLRASHRILRVDKTFTTHHLISLIRLRSRLPAPRRPSRLFVIATRRSPSYSPALGD